MYDVSPNVCLNPYTKEKYSVADLDNPGEYHGTIYFDVGFSDFETVQRDYNKTFNQHSRRCLTWSSAGYWSLTLSRAVIGQIWVDINRYI